MRAYLGKRDMNIVLLMRDRNEAYDDDRNIEMDAGLFNILLRLQQAHYEVQDYLEAKFDREGRRR